MVTRSVVVAASCLGMFLILQPLVPKAMALKKGANIGGFLVEDQRNHKRKNYMMQRARDEQMVGNLDSEGVAYDTEPYDPSRNPEELSAFIVDYGNMIRNVDYANMIRNDVILLDKSVETRTRKRGNIKVKKYNNQAIPDPPCTCEYNKTTIDLGEDIYPRNVKSIICKGQQQACVPPYVCRESYYDVPVLRRRMALSDKKQTELPNNLSFGWIADTSPVSVGCVCARDYIQHN